jgi:hypothetical protein
VHVFGKAKQVAFDDGLNPLGNSCYSEFVFWQDLYCKAMKHFGRPYDDSPMDYFNDKL